MKRIILLLLGMILICSPFKLLAEIKVHVDLPENISEEQVDRLIDKIPPTVGQRKVKTRVEISSKEGTTVKEEKTEENYQKKQ